MAKENVYYPKLDGLRAIACILVLFFHSSFNSTYKNSFIFLPFKGGYLGVDLFFVLSGFLITNILFNQYFSQGKIVIVNFLYKRFLRLYPPIILSTIIFLIPLLFYSPNEAVSNMFFILTYSSDLVILFQKIFPILQYPLRFSHTWSLAIEEQFYLFYPFLLNYVLNYCKIKRINILSSFYAFLILFLLIIYLLPIFMGNWFYKFFLWRFFEIFFGSYLSMLTNISYKSLLVRTTTSLKVEEILVKILSNKFIIYSSIILFIVITSTFFPFKQYILYFSFSLICICLIFNCIISPPNINLSFLENRRLISVGKISYGLYLYHWPLFYLASKISININSKLFKCLLVDSITVGLTFILSYLSYNYVERYFLRLKENIG